MTRQRRVNTDPLRKVVKVTERVHASIFASFKTYYWNMVLECGHEVDRSIKYLPTAPGKHVRRGWSAMHHPPGPERIPDPPKRARCEFCAQGAPPHHVLPA